EVVATFQVAAGAYQGRWGNAQGSRLATQAAADAIAAKVRGRRGALAQVETQARREGPPLLYDLTAPQRPPNARDPFPAPRTLDLAQALYEQKVITYPRTSSRHLSTSVNRELRRHVEATAFGPYVPFVHTILAQGTVTLTARHVDDTKVTDHHAIIPT